MAIDEKDSSYLISGSFVSTLTVKNRTSFRWAHMMGGGVLETQTNPSKLAPFEGYGRGRKIRI